LTTHLLLVPTLRLSKDIYSTNPYLHGVRRDNFTAPLLGDVKPYGVKVQKHATLRSTSLVFPMATAYRPVFLNQDSSEHRQGFREKSWNK